MNVKANLAGIAFAFFVSALAVVYCLGGSDVLMGRPIVFNGDATFHTMYAKMVLQHGWSWHSTHLGAPLGFSLTAFGVNLTPETLVMSVLKFTTSDAVSLLNRTWICCIGLTAVNGYLALRLLQLPRFAAAVCGILYAVIPYNYFRHVGHFNLNYTFAALPLAVAALLVVGDLGRLDKKRFYWLLAACALPGFAYIYNAFFLGFLFSLAIVLALLGKPNRANVLRGCACLGVLVGATLLNLAPTVISWQLEGRPGNLDYKTPDDADTYALQIRDLVLPDATSPIPFLRDLGAKSNAVRWPHRNENQSAKLGTVGALGFILSMLLLLGIRAPIAPHHQAAAKACAALVLALLLLSVAGGFGSLFNLFVVSDIRCYNRVAPLIAFLSLFVFGAFVCWLTSKTGTLRLLSLPIFGGVLVFGLCEQNTGAHLRDEAKRNAQEANNLRSFVAKVEATLPSNASVFMLPITPFPADSGQERMRGLDHAKPTLFSQNLKWSWPHFGRAHEDLVKMLGSPPETISMDRLRSLGYTHLWVDTFGPAEEMKTIDRTLVAEKARSILVDPTDRYRIYEIPAAEGEPIAQLVLTQFGPGFFEPAVTKGGKPYRWGLSDAQFLLRNFSDRPRRLRLKFLLQGFKEECYVQLGLGEYKQRFPLSNATLEYTFDFAMPANSRIPLTLHTNAGTDDSDDPRDLRFAFFNPRVLELSP